MPLNIVSLVSVGRHPQSGRERRAEQDSRAVELGMNLGVQKRANLTVLHAGSSAEPVLRNYAGVGLSSLEVLELDEKDDAVPSLESYLKASDTDIVLTGVRAESGESSGMVPYLLAETLGWPLVPRIADIVSVEDGVAEVMLALPRGQRRALSVPLPFVASVDSAAPAARQSAYGPGMRANIDGASVATQVDQERDQWQSTPAKPRPKRLKVVKAKTAADRFKAATAKPQGKAGKVMKNESAQEQAEEIFKLLLEEKVIR